jgi:hypothetical protein
MNRLYAVEGYSLTGAMADHRLRLESRQIALPGGARCALLHPELEPRANVPVSRALIDALAGPLANRGKGLIVAGNANPRRSTPRCAR